MNNAYQLKVDESLLNQNQKWLNWLPALAWLPFPLVINSIIIPPIISIGYWARWIGLIGLTIFGFWKLFLPGRWKRNKFDIFTLIIIFIIAISTFFADIDGALYATNFYQTGVFKAVSILLTYLSLSWGVQSIVDSIDSAKIVINNLLLLATFIFVVGLIGNLSQIIPPSLGAPSGIFFNPNTNSALGIVIFPLSTWFAFVHKKLGIIRFLPAFVIVFATILSGARTSLFAVSILIIYQLICRSRYRGWGMMGVYGIFAIGLSLLLILSIDFWESPLFTSLYEGLILTRGGGITSFRTNLLWPLFIQEIFSSPFSALIGHGWGSEEAFLKFQGMQNSFFERWSLGTAHNAYIGLTYQIGFIGSLLTFIPLWSIVVTYIQKSSIIANKEVFEFKLALVSALLAELCLCFFETGFYNIGSVHAFPAWLFAYMIVMINNLEKQKQLYLI
jgi:hypothetical protein